MAEDGIGEEKADVPVWRMLADQIGEQHGADVILFSGGIEAEGADDLIRVTRNSQRRKNVFLLLTTRGGSADAAFRMARALQSHYEKLVLYIHGMCKSAGTLVAVGVDEIVLSDYGEFGPLDVQLSKKDELFESSSGLDVAQALVSLNLRAYTYFKDVLVDIRTGTRGQISTKLAAEIATEIAVGTYGPIYAQIDPARLGSTERALRIAVEYGEKLARQNLKENAVDRLAGGYPSHSFVIDLVEARTLFHRVRAPTDIEEKLGECISFLTRDEADTPIVELLNPHPDFSAAQAIEQELHNEAQPLRTKPNSGGERPQERTDHGPPHQAQATQPPTV